MNRGDQMVEVRISFDLPKPVQVNRAGMQREERSLRSKSTSMLCSETSLESLRNCSITD